MARLLGALRSGDWLHRDRVLAYAGILIVFEILMLAFFVAGTNGLIVKPDGETTTGFGSYYAAGVLAADGTPALAYDQEAHFEAERRVTSPGIEYVYFYYPPVYLLICAALTVLPYLVAFHVFLVATIVPYLLVGRAILQEKGWAGWLLLLASPAVYWTMGLGQNAFLTAALFGGALLLVDRRPFVAGLLFGLICYKPHFGLLIPVALAAGGNWRAFAGAALSLLGVCALSAAVFGVDTWRVYLELFTGAHGTYEHGEIDLAAFVTPFGGARLVGIPVPIAYAFQAVMTLAAAFAVGFVWRRRLSLPIRAASLCAGVLVAVPVALMYDMALSVIAMCWLVRAARDRGWAPWEKTVLCIVFITPMISRWPAGQELQFPLGTVAVMALLAMTMVCARREMATAA